MKLELAKIQADKDDNYRRAQLEISARQSESQSSQVSDGEGLNYGPSRHHIDIGKWKEGTDLQAFLTQFETLAKAYKLKDELYCVELVRALDGEALSVYESLSAESRLNYAEIVKALKTHYRLTESGYRQKLRHLILM